MDSAPHIQVPVLPQTPSHAGFHSWMELRVLDGTVLGLFYRRATELSCTQKPAQKEGGGEADGPRGFQKRTEKS